VASWGKGGISEKRKSFSSTPQKRGGEKWKKRERQTLPYALAGSEANKELLQKEGTSELLERERINHR